MFFRIWQTYDPDGTEYIPYKQLSDFVADLEKPFCIPQPNRLKLISMNFPICQNDTVHCNDILGLFLTNIIIFVFYKCKKYILRCPDKKFPWHKRGHRKSFFSKSNRKKQARQLQAIYDDITNAKRIAEFSSNRTSYEKIHEKK